MAYPKVMFEPRSIEWMKQAFPASFSEKNPRGNVMEKRKTNW